MSETILNKNPAKSADLGEETLKAIEERCEAATPGPWRYEDDKRGTCLYDGNAWGKGLSPFAVIEPGEWRAVEFIAHAREDLPRLLAAYRELKAENERLVFANDTMRDAAALIESLQSQLAEYTATGLTPGDVKDMQGLCKENGLAKYVDLIVEAKRQMSKANERSIERDERIEQLESQLAESRRRESAAVADLKHPENCNICKHYHDALPECIECDFTCEMCKAKCVCGDCRNEDKWEWRGLSEAGKGEQNG